MIFLQRKNLKLADFIFKCTCTFIGEMIRKVNCKLQTKVTRTKGFLAKFEKFCFVLFFIKRVCVCVHVNLQISVQVQESENLRVSFLSFHRVSPMGRTQLANLVVAKPRLHTQAHFTGDT